MINTHENCFHFYEQRSEKILERLYGYIMGVVKAQSKPRPCIYDGLGMFLTLFQKPSEKLSHSRLDLSLKTMTQSICCTKPDSSARSFGMGFFSSDAKQYPNINFEICAGSYLTIFNRLGPFSQRISHSSYHSPFSSVRVYTFQYVPAIYFFHHSNCARTHHLVRQVVF